jgi:transposase
MALRAGVRVEGSRIRPACAASRLLATIRPAGPAETARKQLARDLVAEIRDADRRLKALTAQIAAAVAEHGSRLPQIDGIGPVIAGRLLGRTRHASRFSAAPAFASYAGVAPSRSPAATAPGIGFPGAVTASST